MSDLAYFREKDIQRVSPLLNNPAAWEAFIVLLDYLQSKTLKDMPSRGVFCHDTLVRIAAEFQLIQKLRGSREWIADLERNLKDVTDQR